MTREKICGIYQIRNLVNGKVYIGSSENIEKRWGAHRSRLNRSKHVNPHLQLSWNKHGEKKFVFEVVEKVEIYSYILVREQWYLDNVVKWDFDYNMADIARNPPSPKGRVHSQETRDKISDANRGENHPMFGKSPSSETREKLSKAKRGEDNPFFGKHHSKESKDEMSRAKIGENSWWFGKHHLKETREMISKSQQGEKGNNSKLTKFNVLELRRRYATGEYSQTGLGKVFGVSQGTVWDIVNRKTWKHI